MRRWLLAFAGLAAAALVAGPRPVAVPAGLLLALVLPGAAATAALFPGRAVSRVERLVLVPALSLAVLVVGGLGLYLCGVTLTRWPWVALTAGTTVVAAAATTRRPPGPTPRVRWRLLLPLALAAALLGTAGWVSVASARRQSAATPVTALSMVYAGTGTDTRPVTVSVRGSGDYRLRITGPDDYLTALTFTVEGSWTKTVRVPATGRVTAQLYQGGEPTPCRWVFLAGSSDLAGT